MSLETLSSLETLPSLETLVSLSLLKTLASLETLIGLTDPANSRPISLLPIVSKLLERHVYRIIMDHLPLS